MSLQIRPLSYALGAEIIGVDWAKAVDADTFRQIHRAFLEHDGVLLFRGQKITSEQHIAFSRLFGELQSNADGAARFRHPDYSEIGLVYNPRVKGKPTDQYQGERWHSDHSFTLVPPAMSLLRSIEIPDVGGDTMFANMYLGYESLSDGMKKFIDGLEAVHVGSGNRIDHSTPERLAETTRRNQVAQPLVRTHPETGRKALYLGEYPKVRQFVGMTAEESKPLIMFLSEHATRPQFCYRHVWRKDDLIMWDNRCLMHMAIGDYDKTQNRDMERVTVKGNPSGYIYDERAS